MSHIVVIPKRHVTSLLDAHPEESAQIMRVIQEVAAQVLDEYRACRIVTNLGRYQESKHLHGHVVTDPAGA